MNLNAVNSEIHMYINRQEVVCNKEIAVVENLLNCNSTELYNCYPLSWEQDKDYVSKFYFPKDYSKFEMTINGNVAFRGVVKRNKPLNLSPFQPHWTSLQVLDFKTFLSEGNQLNFVLKDVTIQEAIERIVNEYSGYNFVVGNINIGNKAEEKIKNYNCNEKTPYDCLNYIADLTQSVWVTRYDQSNIAIDFYSYDNLPNGNHILYDKTFFKDNSIVNINYMFNSDDYRNVQIVTANEVQSTVIIENNFIVNGIEETFIVDEPIAEIESITLAGNPLTYGTKITDVDFDVYYEYGSKEITLAKNNIAGTKLVISYYPVIDGRQKMKNPLEIYRISAQNTNIGEIARYEKRDEAYTSQELGQIAQSYLYYKGKQAVTLEIQTLNNDIWNIGDTCYFDNNNIDDLKDLAGNYIVKTKTIKIIQNNANKTAQIFYIYELINNFNFESAINFFDNQRAKNIGNINDGEFINRYIDFENNINIIFSGYTTEELIIEAGNELEAELDFNL